MLLKLLIIELKEKHNKDRPASFVVNISSYSSRILSSRSFSSLSQIIPTCLRENKGCSFLLGDVAAEDVPVRGEILTSNAANGKFFIRRALYHSQSFPCTSHLESVVLQCGCTTTTKTRVPHFTLVAANGLFSCPCRSKNTR